MEESLQARKVRTSISRWEAALLAGYLRHTLPLSRPGGALAVVCTVLGSQARVTPTCLAGRATSPRLRSPARHALAPHTRVTAPSSPSSLAVTCMFSSPSSRRSPPSASKVTTGNMPRATGSTSTEVARSAAITGSSLFTTSVPRNPTLAVSNFTWFTKVGGFYFDTFDTSNALQCTGCPTTLDT